MKTKLLITMLGLIPVLAMAEVNISVDPISGRSVPSEPTPVYGETPRGVEYNRTTTDTGARTVEIIGQNGYYEKTTTSPGNSTTRANYDGPEGYASYYKSKSGKLGDTEIERVEEHNFDLKKHIQAEQLALRNLVT